MLINVLEELLDVWVTAVVKARIIDLDDDVFKVVFLLIPLEVLLEFWQRESLKEDLHAQMFEVVRVEFFRWLVREIVRPPFE